MPTAKDYADVYVQKEIFYDLINGVALRDLLKEAFLAGAGWQRDQDITEFRKSIPGWGTGNSAKPYPANEQILRDHEAMNILRKGGYHVWLSHDDQWHAQGGTVTTIWDDPAKAITELRASLDREAKSPPKEESRAEKAMRILVEQEWELYFNDKVYVVQNRYSAVKINPDTASQDPTEAILATYEAMTQEKKP